MDRFLELWDALFAAATTASPLEAEISIGEPSLNELVDFVCCVFLLRARREILQASDQSAILGVLFNVSQILESTPGAPQVYVTAALHLAKHCAPHGAAYVTSIMFGDARSNNSETVGALTHTLAQKALGASPSLHKSPPRTPSPANGRSTSHNPTNAKDTLDPAHRLSEAADPTKSTHTSNFIARGEFAWMLGDPNQPRLPKFKRNKGQ